MLKQALKNLRQQFATSLDQYYYRQPKEVGIIFTNSNVSWTHTMIKNNCQATARGFKQNNFIEGDKILIRLPPQHDQQKLALKIASANLKLKPVVSKANSLSQLQKQFQQTKARAFVFNSFDELGDTTVVDAIYRILPQIRVTKRYSELLSQKYYFLKYLIQLDNYQFPGTFKYNHFIKFPTGNDYNILFQCSDKIIDLKRGLNNKRPLVITDPFDQLSFRAGILNCLSYGHLLVYTSPEMSKKISQKFQHNIDIICTQPLQELHSSNRVYVKAGSKLYEKHPNRIQVKL